MKLNEVHQLKNSQHYQFSVLESHPLRASEDVENTYTGEYRGIDQEEDELPYLLFWIEGESCATPFYYGDVTSIKIIH